MIRRSIQCCILLAGLAGAARADLRVLATASSDSYQALTYGLAAFCQAAGFPFALAEINAKATETLLVPNLAGIDQESNMSLLWLMGDKGDTRQSVLSIVAVLPTVDLGAAALTAIGSAYPSRTRDDEYQIWRYARPPSTNALLAPVIYVAVKQKRLFTSTSREAVAWAASHPALTASASLAAATGQVRIEGQAIALSALLKASREQRPAGKTDVFTDGLERILFDVNRLALTIEAATEGITLHLTVEPVPGSRLAGLVRRMHAPAMPFWLAAPENASVAMAGGGLGLWELIRAYTPTNTPADSDNALNTIGDCLTGDSAVFIGRVSAKGSIYYASLLSVTNSAVAWQRALVAPQSLLPFVPSFRIVTNDTREILGTPVLDYVFAESRPVSGTAALTNNPADMAAFMLRDGGMSLALLSNQLVTTFGPTNAMNQVLSRVAYPVTEADPLPVRGRQLLPSIPASPCSVLVFHPVALVHQIAESLPGMKPERLAALPEAGEGAAAAISRDTNGTLHVLLRVSANEVNRTQVALSEGRAALQDMLTQMALQQMMQRQIMPDDSRHRQSEPAEHGR